MSTEPAGLVELFHSRSHHAFLVLGDREKNYETLRLLVRKKVIDAEIESADVWSRQFETLSIDDARELKETQNTKPNGDRRIVLVSIQTIQHEAQNSLLKLFEEPASSTTFFVCIENSEILLPTLLSRFHIANFSDNLADDYVGKGKKGGAEISEFLSATIAERMKMIEPIVKEKDRAAAERFLNNLEFELFKIKNTAKNANIFEEIFSARRFLRSRSSSVKMILEHICGIIPVS